MIVRNKRIHRGVPVIDGTRIDVNSVLACIRDDMSFEEISICFAITQDDIKDCIDYAIKSVDISQ